MHVRIAVDQIAHRGVFEIFPRLFIQAAQILRFLPQIAKGGVPRVGAHDEPASARTQFLRRGKKLRPLPLVRDLARNGAKIRRRKKDEPLPTNERHMLSRAPLLPMGDLETCTITSSPARTCKPEAAVAFPSSELSA